MDYQGELVKAIDSLKQICHVEPTAYVSLATLYLKLGDQAQTKAYANDARLALQSRLAEDPRDAQARLQLVRALTLLQREKEALINLGEGFELTKQPVMQQAAGEVLVCWANRLASTEGAEATHWQRLQMIHRATQCAPQDTVVLAATVALIREFQVDEADKITVLRNATALGIERTTAHWMLGWLHAFRLQDQPAFQHFRQALDQSPEVPTVLNNLTIYLRDRAEVAEGCELTLINLANELLPGQPQFLETRARVFMTNRRWHEAIADLQQAVNDKALQPQVYPQLIRAYQEIGDHDAACVMQNCIKIRLLTS